MSHINIRGAQTHNLKSLDLDVPKHQLVAFTGVSGSGKSSLVFDTIYTEAQRQLIETFSTYARRRLPKFSRPPVDEIHGISPCIVIDQKRLGASSRSTVGTATEIYTYLRTLFSRCGAPFIGWGNMYSFNNPEGMCLACKGLGKRITVDIDRLLDRSKSIEAGAILHPDYDIGKWYWREIMDSEVLPTTKPVSDFTASEMERLLWADGLPIEHEFRGVTYKRTFDGVARKLEQLHVDKDEDQISGVRQKAYERLFTATTCPDCGGARLSSAALSVELAGGWTIGQLVDMELVELDQVLKGIVEGDDYQPVKQMVEMLVTKMRRSLGHLIDIGVGYLSLNRGVPTLSGGESQRVKMARQLDCDLVDLIYILDEPSIGLHPRDIDHLITMLHRLRDNGNSVLVVEHDPAVIRATDWVVDIGPRAGTGGGELMFSGSIEEMTRADTATAHALRRETARPQRQRRPFTTTFDIAGATSNNLRDVSVGIPQGVLTCITGVAGSGKSSLVAEFLAAMRQLGRRGAIVIDQKPVGRSSRSNPATYIGIFDAIRRAFASANGVDPGVFSFNGQGSCPECRGRGFIDIEMSFLDDVRVECGICEGKRYREEIFDLTYHGRSIHDVLEMTVADAISFFTSINHEKRRVATITRGLQLLLDVGVGYLRLGQSLSTLSGGEAQRIKLASELTKTGNIYVMDEPTTGLHPTDIDRLLAIIDGLIAAGNTVIVIEHNLDVIAAADWIIDLGPDGGKNGGFLVAEGTPEAVAARYGVSHTGRYLSQYWSGE